MTRKRFISDCHHDFKKAIFRIVSNTDTNTVFLELKKDDDTDWTTCLEYKTAIDWHVHTYLSSGTSLLESRPTARAVIIDSISFYDNEMAEMEGEQLDWINEQEIRDFKGTAEDLLHLGNVDGAILKDENLGRNSYNDKLLKYNSKYAQLIGKQKSNVDEIAKIVSTLPHLELIDKIRRDIHELDKK